MKKLLYTLILSVAASCTHRTAVEADYNVVPLPCSMLTSRGGDFRLTPSTCLVIADSTQFVNAELFAGYIETLTGFRPAIIGKAPVERVYKAHCFQLQCYSRRIPYHGFRRQHSC